MVLLTFLLASNTVKMANLEWQDDSEAKTVKFNWKDANDYCQELDLAGYNDWRLPNIKELQSIVNKSRVRPAIKKNFKNVALGDYWSSSQYVHDSESAWAVFFKVGHTNHEHKFRKLYIRCVRDRE